MPTHPYDPIVPECPWADDWLMGDTSITDDDQTTADILAEFLTPEPIEYRTSAVILPFRRVS